MKKAILTGILLISGFNTFGQFNIDSLESALERSEGAAKAKTYNELFNAYVNLSPTKAMENARLALNVAREAGDNKGTAAALNNLGIVYKNQAVYDKALDYYLQSLRISTKMENQLMVASTLNNIGTVYSLKGIYDKALIYYIESSEAFEKLNVKNKLIGAYNNIGNAYFQNGLEDKALDFYKKASEINHSIGAGINSDALNNIGNVYFAVGDYRQALHYYNNVLVSSEKTNHMYGKAMALANIGTCYTQLENLLKAEENFHAALTIAEEISDNLLLKNIYGGLSKLYNKQGRYRQAYETLVIHDQYEDYIHNEESSRRISQMEAALEFEKKEKEIDMLRKQSEIDQLVIANSRIFVMITILGAILSVAIGMIIYLLQKNKKVSFYR